MSVLQQLWIPLNNEQHHTWQIVWLTSGNILWVLILCLQVSSHPNVRSAPVGIPQVVAPGAHQHQQHHLIIAILYHITCRQWFCIDRPGCNWLRPDSQADRSRRCRSACRSSPSSSAFTTWVPVHLKWMPWPCSMATMPWCPPKPGGRLPRPFCPFRVDLLIVDVDVNVDDQPTPDFSPNNFNCLLFVVAKLLNLCSLQLTSTHRIRLTHFESKCHLFHTFAKDLVSSWDLPRCWGRPEYDGFESMLYFNPGDRDQDNVTFSSFLGRLHSVQKSLSLPPPEEYVWWSGFTF